MRFEQEAFDPQGGGTGISGPTFSREHTLFEAIVEPVFLEAHEENLLFELAKVNNRSFQNILHTGAKGPLTTVAPEKGNDEEEGGETKCAEAQSSFSNHGDFFTPNSDQTCFICADKPPNAALLPCGHGGPAVRPSAGTTRGETTLSYLSELVYSNRKDIEKRGAKREGSLCCRDRNEEERQPRGTRSSTYRRHE